MPKKNKRKKNKFEKQKSQPFKISLSMIVKDEEEFLEGCLQSVTGLVDEIVIADTGSADNTRQIAQKYNAKIFDYSWKNDFSKARNFALKKTRGDWVVSLDADERLHKKYHQDIKRLIQSDQFDALLIKIRSEVSGSLETATDLQTSPRIFRNKKNIEFVYPVHEQIQPAMVEKKFRMVQTGIVIEHLGYAQSEDIIHRKIDRNRQFLERQIASDPDNAYAHYHYAQTLRLTPGREQEAYPVYEKAIMLAENQNGIKATCYLQLASMELLEQKYNKTLRYINRSLKATSKQWYGLFMKGEVLFLMENYRESLPCFEEVERLKKIPNKKRISELMTEKEISGEFLLKRMIRCHLNLKNFTAAEKMFREHYRRITQWGAAWMPEVSAILMISDNPGISFGEIFNKIIESPAAPEQQLRISENILHVLKWVQYPEVTAWLDTHLGALCTDHPEYALYFSQAYLNTNNLNRSLHFIELYISRFPEEAAALELKGTVQVKLGELAQAIHTYEHLLYLQPDNLHYYKILGDLFAKTNQMEKASQMALRLKELM